MLKSIATGKRAPHVTVETLRDPYQALSDKRAQVIRRIAGVYESLLELERLAAWLDPKRVSTMQAAACAAATGIAGVAMDLQDVRLEALPRLAVMKRSRRARRDRAAALEGAA